MAVYSQPPDHATNASGVTMFNLPLFIREQIYDLIFNKMIVYVHLTDDYKSRGPQVYPDRTVPCPTLALAQTCRFLRAEALRRIYEKVTFSFYAADGDVNRLIDTVKAEASQVNPATTESRLRAVSSSMKYMQRINIDHHYLPAIGWDSRSFIWMRLVNVIFPSLRQLEINVDISACRCDHVPLSTQFDAVTGQYIRRMRNVGSRSPPPEVSDGVFLCKLALSSPRHFKLNFDISLVEHCTAYCTTHFKLYPGPEKTKFELVEWANYYSCRESLVEILKDYGLDEEAKEMQKMIDENPESETEI